MWALIYVAPFAPFVQYIMNYEFIGKKLKKKKMTTLSIQEFLGPKAEDLVIKKTSWADEMEQQGNDCKQNELNIAMDLNVNLW